MEIQVSTVVERPVADVWRFYAVDHVRNHPRWDRQRHLLVHDTRHSGSS